MKALLSILTLASFLITSVIGPMPQARADEFRLPAPGVMVHLSPEFNPPILKGIKVHPDNPFRFDFILDKGEGELSNDQLKDESAKLIKYFLASLTIPEKDLWVNLSPYEKDRIIPQSFGLTEMGRDLLAEDYMLKQITASLIYPEDGIGKKFWKRIYEEAQKKFGTSDIPVNTFNKVWILPQKAVVYENAKMGTAYVVESKLKVMLEQDYLSMSKHADVGVAERGASPVNALGSQIIREIVIPELTREINENKNFVKLRQVYNSLILATWYKKKIKDSVLSQVYADKSKVVGVNIDDPKEKDRIYQKYLRAFKKGVFNYIKEDTDALTQETIPRKYFSGGTTFDAAAMAEALDFTSNEAVVADEQLDHAMIIKAQINSVDAAMVFNRRKFLGLAGGAAATYSLARWGVSPKKLFTRPESLPEIVFEKGRIVTYKGKSFQVSAKLSGLINRVETAGTASATREFWADIFKDYPAEGPVSGLIPLSILGQSSKQQLDAIFNGLRTQPRLLYRYLSEVSYDQPQKFSHYFAKLKPGIRQQVFAVLYQWLMEDFQKIENGKAVKSIMYKKSIEQAEHMRQLYGEMTRALNVMQSQSNSKISEAIPFGPLVKAPDDPVAPYEEVAFTIQQAAQGTYKIISQLIDEYRSQEKGYTVVMPGKEQVNMGDIMGLIHPYRYPFGVQSFYVENNAARLLKWIRETTSSGNPDAHRITQGELIRKAFEFAEDPKSNTVDLFNAIASIGHLFKSLARNPTLVLGASLVMGGQDGVDYIWNHFQPGLITYSLYSNDAKTVDDQGRPVLSWRHVDDEGDDTTPSGQKIGIKFPDIGHHFYHGWGILLTGIYARLKGFGEIETDMSKIKDSDWWKNMIFLPARLLLSSTGYVTSGDMPYLPLLYKAADEVGLLEFGLNHTAFSAHTRSETETIFDKIGRMIKDDITQPDSSKYRVKLVNDKHPRIIIWDHSENKNYPDSLVESTQGGLGLDQLVIELNNRWGAVKGDDSDSAIRERAGLILTADQILKLGKVLKKPFVFSSDFEERLGSSVENGNLPERELKLQYGIFDRLRHGNKVTLNGRTTYLVDNVFDVAFINDVLLKYDKLGGMSNSPHILDKFTDFGPLIYLSGAAFAAKTIGEFRKMLKELKTDMASNTVTAKDKDLGGIDLTPANMNLQTQNGGEGIKFHLDPAMLQQLQNAPGFVPVIINIQPLNSISAFLGLEQTSQSNAG